MPQYMILIYGPTEGRPSPEQLEAEFPKWGQYTQSLQDAGVMVAGDALQGTDTATTVRVRDGETVVSDGPFAETKEALGGYYVVDVPDLDEALKCSPRSSAKSATSSSPRTRSRTPLRRRSSPGSATACRPTPAPGSPSRPGGARSTACVATACSPTGWSA